MTIGSKVIKPCPFCGTMNEIMREENRHTKKCYYICNEILKHHNAKVFYHERLDIASVIDDLDKMEVNNGK